MKKILGLTVALIAVIAMLGTGTWAYFNDVASIDDNTITAGKLYFKTGGVYNVAFTTEKLKPSDPATDIITKEILVNNEGDLDGWFNLAISGYTDTEGTVTPVEAKLSDSGPAGELGANIKAMIGIDIDNDGTVDSYIDNAGALTAGTIPAYDVDEWYAFTDVDTYSSLASATAAVTDGIGTLEAGNTAKIIIKYVLPASTTKTLQIPAGSGKYYYAENVCQDDIVTFDVVVYLDQKN